MSSATFLQILGGDGSTVSDDLDPNTGLRNRGHITRFVAALKQFVAICNFVMFQQASAAAWTATGNANLVLTAGADVIIPVQLAKGFVPGLPVYVAKSATASVDHAWGLVKSYNAGTGSLVVTLKSVGVGAVGGNTNWQVGPGSPAIAAGWQPVETQAPVISVAAIDFIDLDQKITGASLYFTIDNLSGSSTQDFQILVSDDGVTFSTAEAIATSLNAASAYDGTVEISNVRSTKAAMRNGFSLHSAAVKVDDSSTSDGRKTIAWSGNPRTIRFQFASGTIDAGTIIRLEQKA